MLEPVKYETPVDSSADIFSVTEFRQHVKDGLFVDYDGYGHPIKNRLMARRIYVQPSKLKEIPSDATHIAWYNR